jgi:hypothetical protein
MRGHAPLPARFFNYQSQPATFLVQPPTSNHSETPGDIHLNQIQAVNYSYITH